MSISHKLKWKRCVNALKYCHEELELLTDISNDSAGEFQAYYEAYCAKNDIDIKALNKEHSERLDELYDKTSPELEIEDGASPDELETAEEPKMSEEELELHESFSKLFKKVALKLHPDRIDRDLPEAQRKEMIEMFQKANRAMDERKYFIVIGIAEELNITTPKNYTQQSRWMKRQIKETEELIRGKKETYNVKFSETDTDEERDILIQQFLYQLFQV